MGLLTADPYENAWIILGLGVAGALVLVAIGGGAYYSARDRIPTLEEVMCTGVLLASALIPLGLFSSGIFIDFINQSYNYSAGSIVGFLGAVATALFGSSGFADFSKRMTGFLPSMRNPIDGGINWMGILTYGGIAGVLAAGTGVSFGVGGSQIGEAVTLALVVPLVLIVLAGNGFMGAFTPQAVAPVTGGSSFQIQPYPSGYCDVPGFTWASNTMAPVSIVLTQTILWFHMIQDWDTGNTQHTALLGTGSLLMFALQWFGLSKNDCLSKYTSGTYSPLVSLVVSIAVAGTSYGVLKNMPTSIGSSSTSYVKPTSTNSGLTCPSGYVLNPDSMCEKTLTPSTISIPVGGQQKTSEPVDDQDAFVCEAYKDGELVTSTIVD